MLVRKPEQAASPHLPFTVDSPLPTSRFDTAEAHTAPESPFGLAADRRNASAPVFGVSSLTPRRRGGGGARTRQWTGLASPQSDSPPAAPLFGSRDLPAIPDRLRDAGSFDVHSADDLRFLGPLAEVDPDPATVEAATAGITAFGVGAGAGEIPVRQPTRQPAAPDNEPDRISDETEQDAELEGTEVFV